MHVLLTRAMSKDQNIINRLSSKEHPNLRFMNWGIFTVAYDTESFFSRLATLMPSTSTFSNLKSTLPTLFRFVADLWRLAPWYSLELYVYLIWTILYPGVSTCIGYLILLNIRGAIVLNTGIQGEHIRNIQSLVPVWLLYELFSRYVLNMIHYGSRVKLGPQLRAHFLPKLVEESLKRDPMSDRKIEMDHYTLFPHTHRYGDFIPGWDAFDLIFTRLRHVLAIIVEIIVCLYFVWQQDESYSHTFSYLTALFILVAYVSPIEDVGKKGYTFWTRNTKFNRLLALYNIVFDLDYRPTLTKDGQAENLIQEYKRLSDSLGPVQADTYILSQYLYPAWHMFEVMNSSLIVLALSWIYIASSPILLLAILQYSIIIINGSIEYLRRDSSQSFIGLAARLKTFYKIFDESPEPIFSSNNGETYTDEKPPLPDSSSENSIGSQVLEGAKISLKNVSYKLDSANGVEGADLKEVNVDIQPGQLVVVTEVNGSDNMTALVKLMSGLASTKTGEVIISDKPVTKANDGSLLQSLLYIGGNDLIYPLSLEENILMAIPNKELINPQDIHDAIELGGATDILESLGRKTMINSCNTDAWRFYGESLDPGAKAALNLNEMRPPHIRIPAVSRQKIVLARAFLRLQQCNINLIVLDGATSAMDSIEEARVINNFLQIGREKGITMIIATNKLSSVVKHADMILCIDKGGIVEKGTHEQLMSTPGVYSLLYNEGDKGGSVSLEAWKHTFYEGHV